MWSLALALVLQGSPDLAPQSSAPLATRVSAERLADWHELVASEPHAAGSEGDQRLIETLAKTFRGMGLEVEVHRFTAYLSAPVSARLQVTSPFELELPLSEPPLPGAPASEAADAIERLGWNAYSGSGDVTAPVVYANYGRREDFEALRALEVDCEGCIVICRYGGNFRGYKAKYAEEAGAAGLLIYTDPRDSGFGRGTMSPEGGWATCDQIQRGSLKTLPWSGDPLTPGVEARAEAARLDPDEVALPRIPVQPCGWIAATQIMAQMKGPEAPKEWRGGLPLSYRLTGGEDLRVRLAVEQTRGLVESANVIARLPGKDPAKGGHGTMIGCHHDAWVYGASDPTSGLIGVLEAARVLTDRAKELGPPRRPITFAAWGAEEHGIIGSTEFVEAREDAIRASADAYINLDAAAGGMNLYLSASPSMTALLREAAAKVPVEGLEAGTTALDAWRGKRPEPRVGFLGGGSDHVSFLARCGVPSVSINAGGAPGTAYHSLYDDLTWYRRVVGADYRSARMVTGLTVELADRISRAQVLPLTALGAEADLGATLARVLEGVELTDRQADLLQALLGTCGEARKVQEKVEALGRTSRALDPLTVGPLTAERADVIIRGLDRAWLRPSGLPGRPWYKNLYTAPDETSGYAPWPLPGIQKARLEGDADLLTAELEALEGVLDSRLALARSLAELLEKGPGRDPAEDD